MTLPSRTARIVLVACFPGGSVPVLRRDCARAPQALIADLISQIALTNLSSGCVTGERNGALEAKANPSPRVVEIVFPGHPEPV